jgi:hypothetical protein
LPQPAIRGNGRVANDVPNDNIQPEVPPANVAAMFDSAYVLGRYPLGFDHPDR